MVEPIAGSDGKRKCDSVADAINRLLHNLIIKCARGEGIRNFYQVSVIGYGHRVTPAFSGVLAGRDLVPLSEIANAPARVEERIKKVEDGAGGVIDQKVKFPIWFEPVAQGITPMGEALNMASHILTEWVPKHPKSFPPIVINISDGESTDSGPAPQAEVLRNLHTDDGEILLFNCHISSQPVPPVVFPDSDANLPDRWSRVLFETSSKLPAPLRELAKAENMIFSEETRGFAFNADLVELIRFLDIGTRSSNLR